MTTITITKSSTDKYKKIECSGHAGYADSGEDIVCSAISILTLNLANSIEKLTKDDFSCDIDEDNGYFSISFDDELSKEADLLVRSFELGIDGIFRQYGKKFLNIKFRRDKSC